MSEPSWNIGDYLTHRFNPELGIGRVTALEARALLVEFPRSGTTLGVIIEPHAFVRPVRGTLESRLNEEMELAWRSATTD